MAKGNKILIAMAAGSGTRMGSVTPKQFLDLGGKPVLRRTIEAFVAAEPDIRVITVLPKEHISYWKEYCLAADFSCPQLLVQGGFTRFHSVRNALEKVPDGAIVAIHDGVRPLVSPGLISGMFSMMATRRCHALIPVLPSTDTLRLLDKAEGVTGFEKLTASTEVIDRSRVYRVQTPQMFKSEDIKEAYSQAFDTSFTDDASVAYKKGIPLSFCEGERYNFKLTSPEDLEMARMIISSSPR